MRGIVDFETFKCKQLKIINRVAIKITARGLRNERTKVENGEVAADNAAANGLALALTGAARTVAEA
jgi:hypothetical protein